MMIKKTVKLFVILLIVIAFIFVIQHSTYYKYNDWWIKGRNIEQVRERYGEFDFEEGGSVGYFLYHGAPFIWNVVGMGDSLDRYYYMEIDESGVVHNVYVSVQRGG